MEDFGDALFDAVERAVRSGERELDDFDGMIGSLLEDLEEVTGLEVAPESGLGGELVRVAEGFGETLRAHLARQRDALSTFNVAFFGRTGTGKSTLLSAFGQLDGEYVSPGESDWTTGVTEIAWRGCRLWDTPGINGWGRTQSRAELEETARRAVEVADTVLLCFDTQSQQASEFARVAEWVREYGKPVVAVLNVRNLRWRHPARVASESARQSLSRSVREHVGNIRTELAKIGLPDTSIVAVQSRRALFSRAATPFKGPAAANFESDRERFGVDYLSRWSNFAVLEELIAASIDEGGAELRKTALREGLRGMLDTKADELDLLTRDIDLRIAANERRIEDLLDVLGYIEGTDRKKYLGSNGTDLLTAVEAARGVRFTSDLEGRLDRYVGDLLRSHLSGPREDSLGKADELVDSAFSDGTLVDESGFERTVFRKEDIEAGILEVFRSASAFLWRELQISGPAVAPVPEQSTESATLDGRAGRKKRNVGQAMKSWGLATGALAGVAAVPAVVNIWNPAGWASTAAVIALGAVSELSKNLGSRAAESAERQSTAAKSLAVRECRGAVHQTYDRMEREMLAEGRELAWQEAAPIFRETATEAVALRRNRSALGKLTLLLRQASSAIPKSDGAEIVVARARARVLEQHLALQSGAFAMLGSSDSAFGRRVWLGEDWLEDAGTSTDEDATDQQHQLIFTEQSAADRSDLGRALGRAWGTSHAAVVDLARVIEAFIASDSRMIGQVGDLRDRQDEKPTVAVLGDYSSGKSSLVKRLLVELGAGVPKRPAHTG
ncbi:hypothetical protein BFN03_07055 [Rhodococcus sp. WMMA185]|uniref:GTPase n=1 Tax=Rhodococcus sp. WMMA185 TaxID=679318 RepID=UPI000877EDBE|nr:GTPase [Rhodococcus sp. WMMA185]AOW92546.1 hypothetical protein BFN03_07055 [Rhodococcus sp. WMMA185]